MGPKINGFTYKPKSNQRRHYGHRQDLSVIEITSITAERSGATLGRAGRQAESTRREGPGEVHEGREADADAPSDAAAEPRDEANSDEAFQWA